MNCNEMNNLISQYLDDELKDEDKLYFENHLKQCSKCKKEFEDFKDMMNALHNIKEENPPKGYCDRLHSKLINAKSDNKFSKIRWIKYGSIAAALIIVFSIVSSLPNLNMRMGGISKSENSAKYDSVSPAEAPDMGISMEYGQGETEEYALNDGDYNVADAKEQNIVLRAEILDERESKIIKSGTISVETEDYDRFISDISAEINAFGGYLERNNTQVRHIYDKQELKYGNLIIRVPQDNFYDFVGFLESKSKVLNKNLLETDVTKEYYEKDNKVKNLEVQEEHLRQIFEKANTVEEMLQIENELRRVRTEIDALNISLSDIDDRASMSTIDLQIDEVIKANLLTNRDNVWDRARDGFINTINGLVNLGENIVVWIISSSPILTPLIIILIIIFIKIRKLIK